MKTIEPAFQALADAAPTRFHYALRIERPDTQVFTFCSGPYPITINAEEYLNEPGLNISQIVVTLGLGTDNLELTTLDDGLIFTLLDIKNRLWVNSKFAIARYDFLFPSDEPELLTEAMPAGTFGDVYIRDGQVVCELRGWQQYLQQDVGSQTSETCRAQLGDAKCTKDLTTFTVTGTLTSVDSNRYFTDSGRSEPGDYFGNGLIYFTSGENAGLPPRKVINSQDGVFVVLFPYFTMPEVGDEYIAIAGCRKSESICKTKFDNILNFQGEAHVPGLDKLTKPLH